MRRGRRRKAGHSFPHFALKMVDKVDERGTELTAF
ncbi:hypothetical protein EMEDMD4_790165 [Sinorhizobium medicae]|uniref:Uncharacterized protein n=1 Tax=Sinorhizobium medicae TaxID=110321 RepID=A0A508X5J8_9HYPH|nr:hypothetical protein EMEDMD4_790165 [Sinorhizobium medicae]